MKVLSSGLPEKIDDNENLVRFLTSRSQFNTIMAKPSAFMPNPNNGETSVFRHDMNPQEALWQIGNERIGAERPLYGAAIFKAKDVRKAELEVLSQEPPPRHANITKWPMQATDPEMRRAECKERAAIIAQHATLLRRE